MMKNKALTKINKLSFLCFLLIITLVFTNVSYTSISTIVKAEVPSSYDLRNQGYVTSVKNQGAANTCWVFSAIGAIESSLIVGGYCDSSIDLSEGHLGWFAINTAISNEDDLTYGDGLSATNPYQYTGNDLYVIWAIARGFGLELEEYVPYNVNYPDSTKVRENERYVSEYTVTSLDIYENNQLTEIKNSIMENGAVMASYRDTPLYYNRGANGYCFYENIYENTNHAIIIVGWDDNFSKDNFGNTKPSSNGAWLCRNSRGTSWGDDGYFWVSYETTSLKRIVSFKAQPAFDDIYQIYQYDGFGYSKSLSVNDSGVFYASNIFDATENGNLEKIALYSANPDTVQEISVYALNSDYSSPTDGVLLSQFTVATPEIGYKLCSLPSPVKIHGETAFSVVVKITGNGRVNVYSEGINNRASHTGKSFVSADGNSWIDTAKNNYGNLCIKAWVDPEVYEGPDTTYIYDMMLPISEIYYENTSLASLLKQSTKIIQNGGTEREVLNNYLRLGALYQKYRGTVTIETEEQFNEFANLVNSGNDFADIVVELTSDLDFTDKSFIMPSGFGGIFNGNGKIITDINYQSSDNAGLFGNVLPYGCLKNINLSNCSFSSNNYCGGISARNEGLIIGCSFIGTVFSDYYEFGGICGYNEGEIVNCYSNCAHTSEKFGCIAGSNIYGTILRSSSANKRFISEGNSCIDTVYTELSGNNIILYGQNVPFTTIKGLCSAYGIEINSKDDIVYTGLSSENYVFSVLGDVDGDGILSSSDYIRVKSNFLGKVSFNESQELSADINRDGVITSTDYIAIKSHFLKIMDIYK